MTHCVAWGVCIICDVLISLDACARRSGFTGTAAHMQRCVCNVIIESLVTSRSTLEKKEQCGANGDGGERLIVRIFTVVLSGSPNSRLLTLSTRPNSKCRPAMTGESSIVTFTSALFS